MCFHYTKGGPTLPLSPMKKKDKPNEISLEEVIGVRNV
jgi:hypothetical protein